jgi:peptidoglycan/xylan/chitin deacetylase (PgdA/CDA1 family)
VWAVWAAIGVAVVLLLVLAVVVRQPFALVRLLARVRPDIVFYADRPERKLALTFDDGPDPTLVPQILELLAAYDSRATFFMIGEHARDHPDLVKDVVAAGHEIGNHQWRDFPARKLSLAELESELRPTGKVLAEYGPVRLFRPASGYARRDQVELAASLGYRCVLGSVYPYDPHIHWVRYLVWHVLGAVRPGSIVILHEGDPSRRRVLSVLERVLPVLRERGYEIVPVSEL